MGVDTINYFSAHVICVEIHLVNTLKSMAASILRWPSGSNEIDEAFLSNTHQYVCATRCGYRCAESTNNRR